MAPSLRPWEIIAVCGRERGEPPYAARFDDGRVRFVIPGSDAGVGRRSFTELET